MINVKDMGCSQWKFQIQYKYFFKNHHLHVYISTPHIEETYDEENVLKLTYLIASKHARFGQDWAKLGESL